MEHTLDEGKPLHHNAKPIRYVINDKGCHVCVSHKPGNQGYPKRGNLHMSRYVWELKKRRTLDTSEHVLHKCGNNACINLRHLYIGDHKAVGEARVTHGKQVRYSSLSDADIRAIKKNIRNTSVELAEVYQVSDSTIRNIWNEAVFAYIKVKNYPSYCAKRKERLMKTRAKQLQRSKGRN